MSFFNMVTGVVEQVSSGSGGIRNPLEILGSRLNTWINMEESTITDDGSGNLISASDLSGNNNNLNTEGIGTYPSINPTGLGGKRTITFDGISELALVNLADEKYTFLHNGSRSFVIVLCKILTSDPNEIYPIVNTCAVSNIEIGYSLSFDDRSSQGRDETMVSCINNGTGGVRASQNLTLDNFFPTQEWAAVLDVIHGNDATLSERSSLSLNNGLPEMNNTDNGSTVSSDAYSFLRIGWDRTAVGVKRYSHVELAEIIIGEGAVTSQEISELQTYLNDFWGEY